MLADLEHTAYTLGYRVAYDAALAEESSTMKTGARCIDNPAHVDHYVGGWVFMTVEDARQFLTSAELRITLPHRVPADFSVYELALPAPWATAAYQRRETGTWHLALDARIIQRIDGLEP